MRWLLLLALFPMLAQAGTVTISWVAPAAYADDNTTIPAGAAFQYKLYGARQGAPLAELETLTATKNVRTPADGTHCYAVAAAIIDPATGQPGPYGPQTEPKCVTVGPTSAPPPPPPPAPRAPTAPLSMVITVEPAP